MTKTQALLVKACNIGEVADNIDFFGATDTRLDKIILDANRLIALAMAIKDDLQNADNKKPA